MYSSGTLGRGKRQQSKAWQVQQPAAWQVQQPAAWQVQQASATGTPLLTSFAAPGFRIVLKKKTKKLTIACRKLRMALRPKAVCCCSTWPAQQREGAQKAAEVRRSGRRTLAGVSEARAAAGCMQSLPVPVAGNGAGFRAPARPGAFRAAGGRTCTPCGARILRALTIPIHVGHGRRGALKAPRASPPSCSPGGPWRPCVYAAAIGTSRQQHRTRWGEA